MRLSTTIKVVLGFAASGSLVLGLGGSAFAADSTAGVVTQEATVSQEKNEIVSTTVETVQKSSSSMVKVEQSQNSQGKPVGEAGSAAAKAALTAAPGAAVSDTQKLSGSENKTSPVVADTPNGLITANAGQVAVSPAAVSALVAPMVVAATPVQYEPGVNVVVNSKVLPIQPVITTTRPVANDLAASVPTAPVSHESEGEVPQPSGSGALFSRLSAVLAGSVVPSLFMLSSADVLGMTRNVVLLLMAVYLAFLTVSYAFGGWTRRGGYAHAARSDVGSGGDLLFATPFGLSYAAAFVHQRSSFLMVSDKKPYYRWFPTLLERRK